MISKNLLKYIKSLELKKNRQRDNIFVAEGPKVVGDLMAVSEPRRIVATDEWYGLHGVVPRTDDVVVDADELRKASFLLHPQQVMALFDIPEHEADASVCGRELCLALDKVQDPGNLGTIIRIADWFGITTIFCSTDTADAYNPKVVQATMGSIAHVKLVYTDLLQLIDNMPEGTPVYGTSLSGNDIYCEKLSSSGLIIMGNEGQGISPAVMDKVTHQLLIPSYNSGNRAESLNVAVATAITCAEFKRQGRV